VPHKPEGKPNRRRWWQRLVRALAFCAVLLCGAYFTLPFWAPVGLIKRHLARKMSRQTRLPVEIGNLRLSWSRGIELTDLRIGSPPGFSDGPMIAVDHIRADFSPLDMFVRKQIAWMEIRGPRVLIDIDADGNVNLAPLEDLQFDANARRISVNDGAAVLRLPQHHQELHLQVSNVEYLSGRVHKLGRVTVSATLGQAGGGAPVGVRLAAGSSETPVAADAVFNFANVDLAQLPLAKLLGLPLRKLSGICRGSVNLQINRRGVVDQFSFSVRVRDLDVQPTDGPAFPVIDEAHLRITAAYDPIAGHLDVQSASIRLPGMDLAGRGEVSTDIGRGNWQAIKTLELEGVLHPSQLAGLLTGRPDLPAKLEVAGPVGFQLTLNREKSSFQASVALHATEAEIRRAGKIIKPVGRKADITAETSLDLRTRRLEVKPNAGKLTLGDNSFHTGGAVNDVRRLFELLTSPDGLSCSGLLRIGTLLSAEGNCEIRDVDSLLQFAGWSNGPASVLELTGPVVASWSLVEQDGPSLKLTISAPQETELAISWFLHKPAGQPLELDLVAGLDAGGRTLRGITCVLAAGNGRIHVTDGSIEFSDEPGIAGSPVARASCRLRVDNVQPLLSWFGPLGILAPGQIRGNVTGSFDMRPDGVGVSANVLADLTELEIAAGLLRKPVGKSAVIQAAFGHRAGESGILETLDLSAQLSECLLSAGLAASSFIRPDDLQWSLTFDFADAAVLTDTFPAVKQALRGGQLAGPLRIHTTSRQGTRGIEFGLSCHADDLKLTIGGRPSRQKPAGVPLRLDVAGVLLPPREGSVAAVLDNAVALLGESRLQASGRFEIRPFAVGAWTNRLKDFEMELAAALAAEEPLMPLLPELSDLRRAYGLSGRLGLALRVSGTDQRISVSGSADAAKLALEWPGLSALGPLTKPSDLPATGEFEMTIPRDLSAVQLNNLQMRIGDVKLLADARAEFGPSAPMAADAHVSAWITKGDTLCALIPSLRSQEWTGRAFLDGQIKFEQGRGPTISAATFQARRLAGRIAGKGVRLSGVVSVRDVQLTPEEHLQVGSVQTDDLELAVEDNRGWLTADLSGLPDRPSGSFRLLATRLDEAELRDWTAKVLAEAASQPVAAPATTGRLADSQADALRDRARDLVSEFRRRTQSARLEGQITIDHFRTFDPAVRQSYDVRQVEAAGAIDRGHCQGSYTAALNGGTVRAAVDVRLEDPVPIVAYETSMQDLVAMENIQPQLALFFPGNTVYGLFSRKEQSTAPLESAIAGALDWRHPLAQTGTAETVTTDGLVEGRAAPRFVANVFPGLNLAQYRYNRMMSFTTFRPDGSAESDMVFSGPVYDMYIEGTTDADSIGRYQIGVILLGSPQSAEWNHVYRQGRIPILKIKARIEGGRMHDEEVSYPWPNETLFVVFLKNNIFYRIWLAARKG